MNIKIDEDILSTVVLKDLYVENISFKREGTITNANLSVKFETQVTALDENEYRVELSCAACNEQNTFSLYVKTVGMFLCESIDGLQFKSNMIAIMFPFLRSQVTIVTAQPNLEPIVLPAININAFLAAHKDKS